MTTKIYTADEFDALDPPISLDHGVIVTRDEPGEGTTYQVYRLAVHHCSTLEQARGLAESMGGDIVLGPEDAALVVRDRRDPSRVAFTATWMGLGRARSRPEDGFGGIGVTTEPSDLKDAFRVFSTLVGPKAIGSPKECSGPGAADALAAFEQMLAQAAPDPAWAARPVGAPSPTAAVGPRLGSTRQERRRPRRR